mmetsp:Transcript_19595/g.66120  ORF Transcript_19595/g.66120 Transcript_19595/m.66120 type:complete len:225 (+) Transcript_19595:301-975(+)
MLRQVVRVDALAAPLAVALVLDQRQLGRPIGVGAAAVVRAALVGRLGEQVGELLVVDLEVRGGDGGGGVLPLFTERLEDGLHRARDDPLLLLAHDLSLHSVRLAGAGLAVRKDCRLEALHHLVDERADGLEDLALGGVRRVHRVEVVHLPDLPLAHPADQRHLPLLGRARDNGERVGLVLLLVHGTHAHHDAHGLLLRRVGIEHHPAPALALPHHALHSACTAW